MLPSFPTNSHYLGERLTVPVRHALAYPAIPSSAGALDLLGTGIRPRLRIPKN